MNEDIQILNAIIHHLEKTGNVQGTSIRHDTATSCNQEVKWGDNKFLITVQRIISTEQSRSNAE